jgi:hypothetical protein
MLWHVCTSLRVSGCPAFRMFQRTLHTTDLLWCDDGPSLGRNKSRLNELIHKSVLVVTGNFLIFELWVKFDIENFYENLLRNSKFGWKGQLFRVMHTDQVLMVLWPAKEPSIFLYWQCHVAQQYTQKTWLVLIVTNVAWLHHFVTLYVTG